MITHKVKKIKSKKGGDNNFDISSWLSTMIYILSIIFLISMIANKIDESQ